MSEGVRWYLTTLLWLSALLLQGSALLTCRFHEWPCKNGMKCVPRSHVCDGSSDCRDLSDESICPDKDKCIRDNGFACPGHHANESRCLPIKMRCDNYTDCTPDVDEANCPQGPTDATSTSDICSWASWSACSATCGSGTQQLLPSNMTPSCGNRTRTCVQDLPVCAGQSTTRPPESTASGNDVQVVIISTVVAVLFLIIAILVEVFMRRKFKLSRMWAENTNGHVAGQAHLQDDEIDLMSRLSGASTAVANNSSSPQHSCPSALSHMTALRLQCNTFPEKTEAMCAVTEVPCSLLSATNDGQVVNSSIKHSPWNGETCQQLVNGADHGSEASLQGAACITSQASSKRNSLSAPTYRITLSGTVASVFAEIKLQCNLCEQGVLLALKQSPLCQRQHAGNELQVSDFLNSDCCRLVHLWPGQGPGSHLGESQSLTFTSLDESASDEADERSSCGQEDPQPTHSVLSELNNLPVPHVSFASETSSFLVRNNANTCNSPVWDNHSNHGNQQSVVICESRSLTTSGSDFISQSGGGMPTAPCNTSGSGILTAPSSISVSDIQRPSYDEHYACARNDFYVQPVTVIESTA